MRDQLLDNWWQRLENTYRHARLRRPGSTFRLSLVEVHGDE